MKLIYLQVFFLMVLIPANGQYRQEQLVTPERNYITVYTGLFEVNVNYERNILMFRHSYSNIRTGIGLWNNLQAYGNEYNITAVHLIGRKSSHFEIDAGIKYLQVTSDNADNIFYPDLFIGYRLEKPDGRFLFRTGLSGLSVINIGTGIKF